MMINSEIIRFCAEECERQQSGEMSVARMVDAYQIAIERHLQEGGRISDFTIQHLGHIVEPGNERAGGGYRCTPVGFADGTIALSPDLVQQAMSSLIVSTNDGNVTAEGFYQNFEAIHPFVDGNGRVGAILYNWINGTLLSPLTPPEYQRGITD